MWLFDGAAVRTAAAATGDPGRWDTVVRAMRAAVAASSADWPVRGALLAASAQGCLAVLGTLADVPLPDRAHYVRPGVESAVDALVADLRAGRPVPPAALALHVDDLRYAAVWCLTCERSLVTAA